MNPHHRKLLSWATVLQLPPATSIPTPTASASAEPTTRLPRSLKSEARSYTSRCLTTFTAEVESLIHQPSSQPSCVSSGFWTRNHYTLYHVAGRELFCPILLAGSYLSANKRIDLATLLCSYSYPYSSYSPADDIHFFEVPGSLFTFVDVYILVTTIPTYLPLHTNYFKSAFPTHYRHLRSENLWEFVAWSILGLPFS
ncbi:hypothetical protein VTL71DRAFT_10530 [Oculimacula yallundae]|uniref:Uncharacterized protein n=1 Tax=Oculimacula yallundae TaxID=86028 RepID=A0ABR4CUS0_9HELO